MPLRLPKNLPRILLIIFLFFFFLQIAIIVWALVTPQKTEAQITNEPAYNPGCFRAAQCTAQNGYWEASAACAGGTGDWGRCYPNTGPITLAIPFGPDRGTVRDLSVYIKYLYEYTVGIGGILATVMIIWGGVVYLTAGGSPGKIGEAKEYISNALIGVVLLFTSYLLLQTLSPDLVNLSMPRAYLIRPRGLSGEFCGDLKPVAGQPLKFAKADKPYAEIAQDEYSITDTSAMNCGERYYEFSRNDQSCLGSKCTQRFQACVPQDAQEANWACTDAAWAGRLNSQRKINDIRLIKICVDGSSGGMTESVRYHVFPDFYYIEKGALPRYLACDYQGFQLTFRLEDEDLLGAEYDDWCVFTPNDCQMGTDPRRRPGPASNIRYDLGTATAWHYMVLDNEVKWSTSICDLNIPKSLCAD